MWFYDMIVQLQASVTPLPANVKKTTVVQPVTCARAHENGRLEEECVTPIEVRSLVKIIEPC